MENTKQNNLAFYSGLIYLTIMALFFIIKICAYFGLLNFPYSNYIFKILIQVGLMFVLPIFLYSKLFKKNIKQTFKFFGFRKVSTNTILLSFVVGIFVFILVTYFSSLWSSILSLFGYKFSVSQSEYSVLTFFLDLLFVAILPGICEETTHRGLVLNGTKKNGAVRAIILTGLLFGLLHLNIVQFGYAFMVGMLLCLVTLLCHSIIPAIIIHFTNNALSLFVSYSLNSEFMHNSIIDWLFSFQASANIVTLVVFRILLIIISISVISMCLTKFFQEGKNAEYQKFKKNLKIQVEKNNLTDTINPNDDKQVFAIYRHIALLTLNKQIEDKKINAMDIIFNNSKNATELLLSENLTAPEKPHKKSYIFYYIAIFVGSVGTILSLISGLL